MKENLEQLRGMGGWLTIPTRSFIYHWYISGGLLLIQGITIVLHRKQRQRLHTVQLQSRRGDYRKNQVTVVLGTA